MSKIQIFANPSTQITIYETPTHLELTCPHSVSDTYAPYFGTNLVKTAGEQFDSWSGDKSNAAAMHFFSQIAGVQEIRTLYKFVPVPVKVETTFPKELYKGPDYSIVEYSAHSIALFCTKDFGMSNSDSFRALGAKFNMNLALDAAKTTKSPGWIFFKSEPNVYEFLNQLVPAGTDLRKITSSPPPKRSYYGATPVTTTVVAQSGVPAVQYAVQPRVANTLPSGIPSMTVFNLPVAPGLNLPAAPPKLSLGQQFGQIYAGLSIPLQAVQKADINHHPEGRVQIAMWGLKESVDNEVTLFMNTYQQNHSAEVEMTVERNNNKMVIVSRLEEAN